MISVSNSLQVNPPGETVELTREDVWRGLVLKAENALPFVPAMTRCEVIKRTDDMILRTVEFRGQELGERITFTPGRELHCERTHGPVLGTIRNVITEDEHGELWLTFSYDLELAGVEAGSEKERDYEDTMKGDYLKSVAATLAAVRRMVAERHPAVQTTS